MILHVALGVFVLLAFGKAQTNENETGDEQHDLVPCSCEEEAAMIESLLEDVGRKAREKDSVVSEMRLEFEQIEQEKAKEFAATLAQRDAGISELRAKVLKCNETSAEYVNKTRIQIQNQRDEIIQLEKEAKRMELKFNESLKGVRLELETREDILKSLGNVLMVESNENLLEKVKEISLVASRVGQEDNHSEDADPGEGNKAAAARLEEMGRDHDNLKDELQRVRQELEDVRRQSLENISQIQGEGQVFASNVSELIDELVACRTGGKEMGILGESKEKMLDVMQKLNEEVRACRNGSWEQGTESNIEDGKNEVEENSQLNDLVNQLESCSGRLLQAENETQVLVERLNEEPPLLHQVESILSGLQGMEGELKGLGEEDSEQKNEIHEENVTFVEIVKHLSDALIIGRELAGLNSNLTDIQQPVADVQQDIRESSHSDADKGTHVTKPAEEDKEKEMQIEMNVDTEGQVSAFAPDDSLLQSRIAELEEELVACHDELHNISQEELFNNESQIDDEDILRASTDSPVEEEEEKVTSDYKGLSTFIGDVLAIGVNIASTGMCESSSLWKGVVCVCVVHG